MRKLMLSNFSKVWQWIRRRAQIQDSDFRSPACEYSLMRFGGVLKKPVIPHISLG
jgi:hypothetical protein